MATHGQPPRRISQAQHVRQQLPRRLAQQEMEMKRVCPKLPRPHPLRRGRNGDCCGHSVLNRTKILGRRKDAHISKTQKTRPIPKHSQTTMSWNLSTEATWEVPRRIASLSVSKYQSGRRSCMTFSAPYQGLVWNSLVTGFCLELLRGRCQVGVKVMREGWDAQNMVYLRNRLFSSI